MLSVARQLIVGPSGAVRALRRVQPAGADPRAAVLPRRGAAGLADGAGRAAPGGRGADRRAADLGAWAWRRRWGRRTGWAGWAGLPPRAGWWSALLVAASPVLAGQPFAVRPDMAGRGAAELGRGAGAGVAVGAAGRRLRWRGVGALRAVGVRQAAPGGGLGGQRRRCRRWGWVRGRLGLGAVARVVLPGVAVAGLVYGVEWLVTGGRVWDAAFVAAANVGRVHPGDWDKVLIVFLGIVNRSAGMVALLAAAGLHRGREAARRAALDSRPALGTVAIGTRPGGAW